MKKNYFRIATLGLLFTFSLNAFSQTIWNGPEMTFTKADYADWSLPENQDRITADVWLTRGNSKPIFNAKEETLESSPMGTEWAIGTIADGVENLVFDTWINTIEAYPPGMLDNDMVLFLVKDSIYIDIRFNSWSSGDVEGGGGFSYERSTGDVSETLWTGAKISFTKENNADWTQEANQDRITDNVWLTRANERGIFNIAEETAYKNWDDNFDIISSPQDTKWAFGRIEDGIENLEFSDFMDINGECPPCIVNQDMVLFLVTDSIYMNIKFTSWTSGEEVGGGGFSYERSTGDSSDHLWTGPVMTFTKENYADWTQAGNQDRITDNVWITRADTKGIFNIAQNESFFYYYDLPSNTRWAFGKTSDGIENLSFDGFLQTIDWNPPDMLDKDMVLNIVPGDIYIDIKFTSWTSGNDNGGGGFSYVRSTNPNTSAKEKMNSTEVSCYPNPATDYIHVRNTFNAKSISFELYDMNGRRVIYDRLKDNEAVSVEHLSKGIYVYKITSDKGISNGKIMIE